jgi:hypothetical protein
LARFCCSRRRLGFAVEASQNISDPRALSALKEMQAAEIRMLRPNRSFLSASSRRRPEKSSS